MTTPAPATSPIPHRVRQVTMPPIDALNTRMAEINAAGGDVISPRTERAVLRPAA